MAKSSKSVNDYMEMMEEWFMKLPALPKNAREGLVNVTPWVALVFGVLGVLASLAGLGLLTAFSPLIALSSGLAGAAGSVVGAVLGLVSSALLLAAFPGTKVHKMQGWKMLFWSEAVSVLAAVLSFSVGGVLVSLLAFYLLFQIKSYYK
jgi:hypothetical protein